jgi:hypothetical protein
VQRALLDIPSQEPGEIVKHVEGEGEGEPVEIGPALMAARMATTATAASRTMEAISMA